jgi:hypothetical protein
MGNRQLISLRLQTVLEAAIEAPKFNDCIPTLATGIYFYTASTSGVTQLGSGY